jgi:hypothetical protein
LLFANCLFSNADCLLSQVVRGPLRILEGVLEHLVDALPFCAGFVLTAAIVLLGDDERRHRSARHFLGAIAIQFSDLDSQAVQPALAAQPRT